MKILISGASGLIGSAFLAASPNDRFLRLVRRPPRTAEELDWSPEAPLAASPLLDELDAAVHLAGENLASGRWNAARKKRFWESRVDGTRTLAEALARCQRPPRVLVCASATGFYGDRGEERLKEASSAGAGFLAELCQAWEAAADPARRAGIRVVHARFGMVLSGRGGALAKMEPLFRWGLGGRLGSGRQFVSWVALPDAVRALRFLLASPSLNGPVNVASPNPVTNAEFTRVLARTLRRPALLAAPRFALRAVFGEMAEAALLASARVLPEALLRAGFAFRYATLSEALHAELRQ